MATPTPPSLVGVLLGDEPLARVMSSPPADLLDELGALRASSPALRWFGVNEDRVDVVVGTDDDEWRLVYVTPDGASIDTLAIYRRPPLDPGLDGGLVVVVNGPSGAGKSSLLDALAVSGEGPWVLFDEPVIGAAPQPYLIWREQAPRMHRGFLDAIAGMARAGNRVALSAAGHPAERVAAAFRGLRVVRVGLDCDLPRLLDRERGRTGRWGGLAESSLGVHEGWTYDLRVDTTSHRPAAIVRLVLDVVASAHA